MWGSDVKQIPNSIFEVGICLRAFKDSCRRQRNHHAEGVLKVTASLSCIYIYMYIFTYSHARFQVCAFLQLYGGSNKVQLFKTSAHCFSHGAFSPLWAKTGFVYFTVPASKGLLRKYGAVEVPKSHTHVEEGGTQASLLRAAAARAHDMQ